MISQQFERSHPPVEQGGLLGVPMAIGRDFDGLFRVTGEHVRPRQRHVEVRQEPLGAGLEAEGVCLLSGVEAAFEVATIELEVGLGSHQLKPRGCDF